MVAGRHNLTRRALLGVGVGACVGDSRLAARPTPARAARGASPMPDGDGGTAAVPVLRRWGAAVAAYRRSEIRVAAHRAGEACLPAGRRAFPCEALEAAFARVDSLRLAALRRLLLTPAPDLPALALKLELAVADSAWETSGCEDCLALAAADARRLAEGG
jgi:hypothetical protein